MFCNTIYKVIVLDKLLQKLQFPLALSMIDYKYI